MTVAIDTLVPDFTAPATGGDFSLKAHRGQKVVIYFYPKDNTPGCTTEGMNFRDSYAEFQAAGAQIVGVSRDSLRSHENFQRKLELPFPLISDGDEAVCKLFGVIKLKNCMAKNIWGSSAVRS